MVLRDIVAPDGHVYLKPEWGPISDSWPAVSFSKKGAAETLTKHFNPERGIIICLGTCNLAKNDVSVVRFQQWLHVVRG